MDDEFHQFYISSMSTWLNILPCHDIFCPHQQIMSYVANNILGISYPHHQNILKMTLLCSPIHAHTHTPAR
jgi:hypothetical protein